MRYTPIVPNAWSHSPQMLVGGSLDLAGGGYSIGKARKLAEDVDGMDMDGEGWGKGTRRKIMKTAKQGALVAEKLVGEFGNDKQKEQAATARKVADTISGAGAGAKRATKPVPAAALRALMRTGQVHT